MAASPGFGPPGRGSVCPRGGGVLPQEGGRRGLRGRLLPSSRWVRDQSWLERRVIAYAHQGGAWEAPSSTLHAIGHALEVGATGIELDVHATADGELVVCHDATVDRTTAGQGTIASFTLAQLRAMDFSYWWIPGADVTPGRPAGDYPFRGRAPDDRLVRHRHAARGPRAVPRGGAEPRHQADGARRDALRGGPGPAPGRVRPHGRRDRGLVPRPGHRRLPPLRPVRADLGGHHRNGRGVAGGAGRQGSARDAGCGLSGARAPGRSRGGRRARSWRRPTGPARRSTCGRSTTPRQWSACSTSGSTGSSRTCPPRCAACWAHGELPGTENEASGGRRRGRQRGVSRGRSSASCRGWPSSSS